MAIPKPFSTGEEGLELHLRAHGISFVREVEFARPRKYRADFMLSGNILIEVEGGTRFGKSRHSRGTGFEDDCRKYNLAATLGFKLLRFSTAMVLSGEAIDAILSAVE